MPKLKVLFVASECAPFATTGGLGDVVGSLPKALRRLGADVRVVLPLYAGMPWDSFERLEGSIAVPMWFGPAWAAIRMSTLPGSDVPIYFLEHNRYFDRPHIYGPAENGYSDNLERFIFLSRGAIELCKAIGWVPDIIHAHDWQTAISPVYVNTVEWAKPMHGCASIYTIHNMAYQGVDNPDAMFITCLGGEHYNPGEFEHFGAMNIMKAGLFHSTLLTTVSPTYAREIQTPEYGCGLNGVLTQRSGDLYGILNGIDSEVWNPNTDPHISAHFDRDDLAGKAICKAALQREAELPVRPDVPIFAIIGRLTYQKGLDVLAHAMGRILDWDVQVVLLGTGDADAERFFGSMSYWRRDRFHAWIKFDSKLAHRIHAGADFSIMPSRFEPCGLNQLYGLRYGTLPIVRRTGGLNDTVANYNEATGEGTGFVFHDLYPGSLADTVGWALSTWSDRPRHIETMRRRAMEQDFSWDRAAKEYDRVYRLAYQRRRGHPFE
jgi:starch synthase